MKRDEEGEGTQTMEEEEEAKERVGTMTTMTTKGAGHGPSVRVAPMAVAFRVKGRSRVCLVRDRWYSLYAHCAP